MNKKLITTLAGESAKKLKQIIPGLGVDPDEFLEKYKDTLVINGYEVQALRGLDEDEIDRIYILDSTSELDIGIGVLCGLIPLKGFLPEDEYNNMVRIWNLNYEPKVI